mmetsp:Transcript_22354/g.31162  ORF Transcript_22354/g.31162 Transcript_22354/m.31162 type:complete len:192 (-) Transcript_22354:51-626(-)
MPTSRLEDVQLDENPEDNAQEEATQMTSKDIQQIFSKFNLPAKEKYVKKFVCSLLGGNGTLYITTNYILFHATFPNKIMKKIAIRDIDSVEKRKSAKVIPNAINIRTKDGQEYFFSAFVHRDAAMGHIQGQIIECEEADKRKSEHEVEIRTKRNDETVKQLQALNKIQATDFISDFETPEQPQKTGCCVII